MQMSAPNNPDLWAIRRPPHETTVLPLMKSTVSNVVAIAILHSEATVYLKPPDGSFTYYYILSYSYIITKHDQISNIPGKVTSNVFK